MAAPYDPSIALPPTSPSTMARFTSGVQKYAPLASAASGLGLGLIGTGLTMDALLTHGRSEQQAAEYNARLAEIEGYYEAQRIRSVARQRASSEFTQRAAKSGLLPEQGGWLDVVVYNLGQAELDAANVEIGARNTARLDRHRGAVARASSKQAAGAALLRGITDATVGLARVR